MNKTYWVTNSRFKYISILLMILWIGFMTFFYLKTDEITKDPCTICAKRLGDKVVCTIGDTTNPISKTYYEDGSFFFVGNVFNNLNNKTSEDGV